MEVVLGPDGSVTFRVLGDKAATAPLEQVAQGGEPIARNRSARHSIPHLRAGPEWKHEP